MDKTGKILWELTFMMKFVPLLIIIFIVWLVFRIIASQTARRLNQPKVSKEIKKRIVSHGFAKISFIPSVCAMGISVVYYLIGSIILMAGGIWAIIVVYGKKDSPLFDNFCDFGFNYWYFCLIAGIIFFIGIVVFFARGIYVNIVYRKKLREMWK